MSDYNYGPLATKAIKIISKFGKTVSLEFLASDAPADAGKPWRGPNLAAAAPNKTPKGVVASFEKDEVDGEHIRSTDIKLLIAAQDPELVGVDLERVRSCTVDGKAYAATDVSKTFPGTTDMLFTLRLR